MFLFDSVKREKFAFEPINPPEVKIYVCGPTVYDHAHIGHARSSVVFDLLRRVLNHKNYKVKFVKNFTDIDDKIIDRMKKEKATLTEITEKYILSYLRDMEALNVIRADLEPKATENISEIIEFIRSLIKKDIAYTVSNGDIYFDTSKDEKYLTISNKKIDENSQISRLDNIEKEKRNSSDFVLWKSAKDQDIIFFEEIEKEEEIKINRGRPGWHIECSAMIDKHLNDKNGDFAIDIHGGGADLLFPHHENEASQSRCLNDQELAKYWIHNGFVKINGEKMSKSLGNSFFIKDALNHYHGELLRFYLLSVHYRQDFNFSEEDLIQAKKRLDKIYRLKKRIGNISSQEFDQEFESKLIESLSDDLNVSKALAVIDEMITSSNDVLDNGSKKEKKSKTQEIAGNIDLIAKILGVAILNSFDYFQFGVSESDRKEIETLIEERNVAKKEKNYSKADEIRNLLLNMNIAIMDTADGTLWEKN